MLFFIVIVASVVCSCSSLLLSWRASSFSLLASTFSIVATQVFGANIGRLLTLPGARLLI